MTKSARRPARSLFGTFALVALLGLCPARVRAADAPLPEASAALDGFDAFVDAARDAWHVPGVAVAVVKENDVVHLKGYGLRDREKGLPVTPQTLFPIASISKSFTATGLGMLADEGKLDWDRPVHAIVPEFQLRDHVADERAAIRDLLSHRTGLPRHDLVWYAARASRLEAVKVLQHLEPSRDFRAAWQYNNLMFLAAGVVAERASGRTWEEFTRDRIFTPLGMTASRFLADHPENSADFAHPYAKRKDTVRRVPFYHDDALGPAGGVVSSAAELARYLQFHINRGRWNGKTLLSERAAEAMQTPQTVMPESEVSPHYKTEFLEMGESGYGLGFFITSYRGHKLIWHSGSIDGYSLLFSFLPREKLGVLVLTNLSGSRPVPVCVTRNVFDRLLGLPPIDWVARCKELDRKDEAASAEARRKGEARR
jgi:CubicO group peptidase (beta-lactamase class C family)